MINFPVYIEMFKSTPLFLKAWKKAPFLGVLSSWKYGQPCWLTGRETQEKAFSSRECPQSHTTYIKAKHQRECCKLESRNLARYLHQHHQWCLT